METHEASASPISTPRLSNYHDHTISSSFAIFSTSTSSLTTTHCMPASKRERTARSLPFLLFGSLSLIQNLVTERRTISSIVKHLGCCFHDDTPLHSIKPGFYYFLVKYWVEIVVNFLLFSSFVVKGVSGATFSILFTTNTGGSGKGKMLLFFGFGRGEGVVWTGQCSGLPHGKPFSILRLRMRLDGAPERKEEWRKSGHYCEVWDG
ncbi:hypothetical protein QBC40DRAFT_95749 [Triangularia verruculosa]|uniref:Uncharacterized protein n=1 Tax=Triangularia verruculosa TaxID=2587418 RepID=A0AAN6XER1_9PEZI|nr:hypothetical protein QBC40DRAFT_95749 [Triangularia verruculosa]